MVLRFLIVSMAMGVWSVLDVLLDESLASSLPDVVLIRLIGLMERAGWFSVGWEMSPVGLGWFGILCSARRRGFEGCDLRVRCGG